MVGPDGVSMTAAVLAAPRAMAPAGTPATVKAATPLSPFEMGEVDLQISYIVISGQQLAQLDIVGGLDDVRVPFAYDDDYHYWPDADALVTSEPEGLAPAPSRVSRNKGERNR